MVVANSIVVVEWRTGWRMPSGMVCLTRGMRGRSVAGVWRFVLGTGDVWGAIEARSA